MLGAASAGTTGHSLDKGKAGAISSARPKTSTEDADQ